MIKEGEGGKHKRKRHQRTVKIVNKKREQRNECKRKTTAMKKRENGTENRKRVWERKIARRKGRE